MRISPICRPFSLPVIATVLPILLLTPPLTATFHWDQQAPNRDWSHPGNWLGGPAGQYPHTTVDTAYVNGAANDPILDFNIELGFFVIQNGGDASTGDGGMSNHSLSVTAVDGGLGSTLIKHAGSSLTVFGSTNVNDFDTDSIKIEAGSTLKLRDDAKVQIDNRLDLRAGGVVEGNGEVEFSRDDGTVDPENDGLIYSTLGTLRFTGHPDTVFDLDGSEEDGAVEAWSDSMLIIDTDVETDFNGTMAIGTHAELQINTDWTLSSEAGSSLTFISGGFAGEATLSGASATLLGEVSVLAGAALLAAPTTIGSTAVVDLSPGTTLQVDDTLVIAAGATVGGTGELSVSDGAQLELASGSNVSVPVRNHGVTVVGGTGAGMSLVTGFEQSATGRSEFGLCGGGGEVLIERLIVGGNAALDGELNLTALGGCELSSGEEFTIITAASVTGSFATVTGLPDMEIVYGADTVTVRVPTLCTADLNGNGLVDVTDLLDLLGAWGVCGGCPADIDGDGAVNVTDLLLLLGQWGAC